MATGATNDPGAVSRVPIGRLERAVFLLLGAAFIATLLLRSQTVSDIGALAMMVGLAAAGIVFIRKSKALPLRERRAWQLLGSGLR